MVQLEVAKFVRDQFICMSTIRFMQWPFHTSSFKQTFSKMKIGTHSIVLICTSATTAFIHKMLVDFFGLLYKTWDFFSF